MTPEDLERIAAAENARQAQFQHQVRICVGTGCLSMHSDSIKDALEHEVHRRGLAHACQVKSVGCRGLCARGPVVSLDRGNVLYGGVQAADVPEIIAGLDSEP